MTTKADTQAAERLLKAAVKRAVGQYRQYSHPVLEDGALDHWCSVQQRVSDMFVATITSAELLLEGSVS